MQISGIMILRDGGTILFEISDDAMAGKYRLQTALLGKPQPLFHDERKLDFGSTEEAEIAAKLKTWLIQNLTDKLKHSLAELDNLKGWQNISAELDKAIPYHRIRHVLHIVEARLP